MASATVWTAGGFVLGQGIRLVSNVVLAHLIAPSAFGLMMLVTTVLQGLTMLSDVGTGVLIVQASRQDEHFLNSVWTLQVLRGCCWALPRQRWPGQSPSSTPSRHCSG